MSEDKEWKAERQASISYEDGLGWIAQITLKIRGQEIRMAGVHMVDPLAASLGLVEWMGEAMMHPRRIPRKPVQGAKS